jgi:NhaP-type Na+/H+ or K+/H+ antiporter
VAGGVAAGVIGALALGYAERRKLGAGEWLQVIPPATAALSYGIAAPLGGSGFIAAFVAGLVFGVLRQQYRSEVTYLVDEAGQVLNAVTFIVFGAVALGPALRVLDWRIAIYAVVSLTVARMLPVAISLLGLDAHRQTVGFVGWFGPRGLASIVFAVIVLEGSALTHVDVVITTILITVAVSVYAHGLTALPLTEAYARWYRARAEPPAMESAAAHEHRWRRPALRAHS